MCLASQVADASSQILTGLTLVGCLYALAARELTRRFATRPDEGRAEHSGVTILKPLHGWEIGLADNLRSFCRQDYRGPLQIVFGLQSRFDPAIPIVRELQCEFPGLDIRLVVDDIRHGSNGKVSNLVNMARHIEHDVVVLADSDMAVEPDYLRRICGALERPGAGLVTCLYRGQETGGLWSRLACMGIAFHFLPSVVVGRAMGLAEPCFGSTIALRRETLAAIGGFEAFVDKLADDYAIGAAVTKLGLRIEVPAFVIAHVCPERSFGDLFRHELRWARTIMGLDRSGFTAAGVTHAFPLAVAAAALRGFDFWGCALIVFAMACRLWLQAGVARALGIPAASLKLAPLRDMISFFVYLACFFGARVDWRGETYRLDRKGNMTLHGRVQKGKAAL